jgi:hypothetical protein
MARSASPRPSLADDENEVSMKRILDAGIVCALA